jgi:hypothetical protein
MQTFIKTMNYTHLMPTRYNLSDVDLKKVITSDSLDSAEKKLAAKKVCFQGLHLCPQMHCLEMQATTGAVDYSSVVNIVVRLLSQRTMLCDASMVRPVSVVTEDNTVLLLPPV